jgi:phosphatidate cytidylyltransferase
MFERSVISIILLDFIILMNPIYYSTFLHFILILGLYEILYVYNKTFYQYHYESSYCILYLVFPIFLLSTLSTFSQGTITQLFYILYYNSVSDIIQCFVGKIAGYTYPFRFTRKTSEGYAASLFFTSYVANYLLNISNLPYSNFFEPKWILINILGMYGGLISSLIKRSIRIKNWSQVLLSHGGINDRLDSWMIPSFCYIFYCLFFSTV